MSGVVFAGFAALFWLGRSRSYGVGDSPQHLYAALTWSVPHPPGYPLQTALGWAWSRLPWTDPGAAVNGLSGVFAALAAAVLYSLLRRGGARREAALTGAALMALSPLFWYYSLVAEVRALNGLLALASALFALEWSRGGRPRDLLAFAAACGLGLSHHPTFVLLLPAYAIWLAGRRPSAKLATAAAALAALALAAPYALLGARLAWSPAPYNLFLVSTPLDLWHLFTRAHLGGPLKMTGSAPALSPATFDFSRLAEHAGWLLSSLWEHGGPVALALAAFGAASARRRDLAGWAAWFGASAGVYLVFSSQQLPATDPEYARAVATRFHLLPLIAVFALAGVGAEALAKRVRRPLVLALLASVLLGPLLLRPLSLARENPLRDLVQGLIRDSSPGDLIVLGGDDTIFATMLEKTDRVFLCPTMFAFPPYWKRFAGVYPGVSVPPGAGTNWAIWLKANPGRAVLAEPTVLGAVLGGFPHSSPQGGLVRVRTGAAKADPAADARRFLESAQASPFRRRDARTWTQEVYVLRSRRTMAIWLASRLDSNRDAALVERLALLVEEL